MERKSYIKYCMVPQCKVNSANHPRKRFISLPRNKEMRNAWFRAARRNIDSISEKTVLLICEDHFNLEKDAANWIRVKYYDSTRVVLKPGVIPHIFKCQSGRDTEKTSKVSKKRPVSEKGVRKSLIERFNAIPTPSRPKPIATIAPMKNSARISGYDDTGDSGGGIAAEEQLSDSQKIAASGNNRDGQDYIPSKQQMFSFEHWFTPGKTHGRSIPVTPSKQLAAEALCLLSERVVIMVGMNLKPVPRLIRIEGLGQSQ